MEDMATELCFQIPDEAAQSQAMQTLCLRLDENLHSLGISSYGISDTTLEEACPFCNNTISTLSFKLWFLVPVGDLLIWDDVLIAVNTNEVIVYMFIDSDVIQVFLRVAEESGVDEDPQLKRNLLEQLTEGKMVFIYIT